MAENVSAEVIAGFIMMVVSWTFLPSYSMLKSQVVNKLCRFVPGGTPEDFAFYWNHHIIRLTLGFFAACLLVVSWEGITGKEVTAPIETALAIPMLFLLGYMVIGKCRQARAWLHDRRPTNSG